MESLYGNVGGKLKGFACFCFVILALASIIFGFANIITDDIMNNEELGVLVGFLFIILGPIFSFIMTLPLYGLGELIETNVALKETNAQIYEKNCEIYELIHANAPIKISDKNILSVQKKEATESNQKNTDSNNNSIKYADEKVLSTQQNQPNETKQKNTQAEKFYFCPKCKSKVVHGQSSCTCGTKFDWNKK